MKRVAIERLAFGGSGFGRIDGKACFVPFTAPGDVADVEVETEKKSYIDARLARLVDPSPRRRVPACPVFGRCGGCQWQHIPYGDQLEAKEEILREALWRSARVPGDKILPPLAAPDEYGYRSRIQLKVHGRGERVNLGFFARGSRYVVDIDHCPITAAPLNALIAPVRSFLQGVEARAEIPQVDMAMGEDGRAVLIFHFIGRQAEALAEKLSGAPFPPEVDLAIQQGRKSSLAMVRGTGELAYGTGTAPPLVLGFGAGGFSQVNFAQNRALIRTVLQYASLSGSQRVLDLYCGNGNLSLPAALAAASVTGIEVYPPSIDDAGRNAAANGITNTTFQVSDVAAGIGPLSGASVSFDLVILDPPRTGGADCARLLPLLRAPRIIYVSCDPPTLGRDLAILARGGYEVAACRPLDMFPQTYHLETVTVLEPAGRSV